MTLEEPVIIVASNVLDRICFSLMILKYFFIDGDDDEIRKGQNSLNESGLPSHG